METEKTDLAAILEKLRADNVWTYRQLSVMTGLSIPTLQKIEERKVRPHKRTIARVKKAFPELFRKRQWVKKKARPVGVAGTGPGG